MCAAPVQGCLVVLRSSSAPASQSPARRQARGRVPPATHYLSPARPALRRARGAHVRAHSLPLLPDPHRAVLRSRIAVHDATHAGVRGPRLLPTTPSSCRPSRVGIASRRTSLSASSSSSRPAPVRSASMPRGALTARGGPMVGQGTEYCNAYSELNDPMEQRARFAHQVSCAPTHLPRPRPREGCSRQARAECRRRASQPGTRRLQTRTRFVQSPALSPPPPPLLLRSRLIGALAV